MDDKQQQLVQNQQVQPQVQVQTAQEQVPQVSSMPVQQAQVVESRATSASQPPLPQNPIVQTAQPLPTTGDPSPVPPPTSPAASDQPMKTLIDQVERDLLAHIYTNLKENKLSGVAAQELAKEFLSLLPFKDKRDLVDKLSTLGQKYPEARETYVNLGIPLEEQQRQERLDQMRAHIQAGDLDKALQVAKGGTQHANGT